jgi:hypothetical protein
MCKLAVVLDYHGAMSKLTVVLDYHGAMCKLTVVLDHYETMEPYGRIALHISEEVYSVRMPTTVKRIQKLKDRRRLVQEKRQELADVKEVKHTKQKEKKTKKKNKSGEGGRNLQSY